MIPDERLLRAAFGCGERARTAWAEWALTRAPGALSLVERRLLPPVYRMLRAGGVPDVDIPPYVKEMARSMWVRTRLLLREASATADLLESHRVNTLLLKGAALVAGGYCDAGARPMSDFDLLVHPADAPRAASRLEEAGWRAASSVDRRSLALQHAALFRKPERSCDLHWWALWDSRDAEADGRYWRDAERAALDGVPVRIPRPEHLILHAIVHGTRRWDRPAVRWIGDALAVVRARGPDLDWGFLAAEAEARDLAFPVGDALAYLVEEFQAPIPEKVVTALRAHNVPRRRRRLYAPRPGPETDASVVFLRSLVDLAFAQRAGGPLLTRVLWLARNLQDTLGARTLAHLPAALTRAGMRALGREVSRARAAGQRSAGKRASTISSA